MADPSIFPFLDQLLAKIQALPACASPVEVWDGAPGSEEADSIVAIGGTVTPVSDSKQRFAQLGAMAMWEEYYLDGLISCRVAGDNGTGTTLDVQSANAQRTARNNAVTIFNQIFEAIRSDPNFSVSNGGNALILYCRMEDVSMRQEPVAVGRNCWISFRIFVKNRIAQA